jgi:nucleoside-diphosphate-sugar epimerase
MKPIHTEARSGEIRHSIAKIDKARRVIGFDPKVPLERGLEDLTGKWVYELA